jgi:hypothetical protein
MKDATSSTSSRPYHAVRFYENEKVLAQIVAEFLADGLINSDPGVVLAAPAPRAPKFR